MPPEPLELPAIADAVRARLHERVESVENLAGFAGNRNYAIRTASARYVFKSGSRDGIGVEAWACDRVRREGVLAPEIVALDLDLELLPVPFLLMRQVPGAEVEHDAGVFTEVGRQLRAIHGIALDGFGFLLESGLAAASGQPRGPRASWIDVMNAPLASLDDLVRHSIVEEGLAKRLRRMVDDHSSWAPLLAYDQGGSLLHADLHPRHFFAAHGRLTGIIDWGDVAVGDPVFDLGRFSRVGRQALDELLRGYEPDHDHAELEVKIDLYRVLWSLQAIVWEFGAGGDWFSGHLEAIEDGLDLLEAQG